MSVSSLHPSALTPLMSSTILTCVAQGILLVYDVTDRGSFNSIRNWVGQIQQVKPSSSSITMLCIIFIIIIFTHPDFLKISRHLLPVKHADVHVNKILIGNKCDIEEQRVVSFEEGKTLAKEYGIQFFETSAKNDMNVETVS